LSRTATLAGTLGCSEFDSAALADAAGIAESGSPQLHTYRHDLGSIEVYLEPYRPEPMLLIFSATPVAQALLDWAPMLGFRRLLVETRPERLTGGAWPPAIESLEKLAAGLGQGRRAHRGRGNAGGGSRRGAVRAPPPSRRACPCSGARGGDPATPGIHRS